jgi:hypothetical protein
MTVTIDGTNGVTTPDVEVSSGGSASAPAITISGDTNTGIFFPAADTIAFAEGGAEAMRIDSSGNVGIGTTSPGTSNTQGASFVPGTSTVASMTGSNGSGQLLLGNNGDGSNLSTNSNCGAVVFKGRFNGTFGGGNDVASIIGTYTGNGTTRTGVIRFLTLDNNVEAERARITSGGALLVGTTTAAATAKVEAYKTGASTTCFLATQGDSGDYCYTSRAFNNGGVFYHFNFTEAGTQRGSITSNGSATAYNTGSDYRLKDNIAPLTGALAKVLQLQPRVWTWKTNGSDGQGFIAHELAEVCPDAVVGEKDAVDADGNPQYQGVDTSFLVATLTAAIQELKAINDAQASRIETLEAKLAALEAK